MKPMTSSRKRDMSTSRCLPPCVTARGSHRVASGATPTMIRPVDCGDAEAQLLQ